MPDVSISRVMWEAVERFHGLTYIAPEVRETGAAAGLKGFYMNYFATRAAPMGAVGPALVQSTFFYYGPRRVHRAIPDAWEFSSPQAVLDARYVGMDQALRRVFSADELAAMAEPATLVKRAAEACEPMGRALYAGWAALDWPGEPHLDLWHGCTLLREFRSGNHLIALCHEGLDGIESILSHVAVGEAPKAWIQDEAGWLPDDEAAGVERLQKRGWLDERGAATAVCVAGRTRVEALTNRLDEPAWDHLDAEHGQRLFDQLSRLAQKLPPDDQLDWQAHYE